MSTRTRVRIVLGVGAVVLLYVLATVLQVFWASRWDDQDPVDAIVVLGAAQYDGTPSPALEARLDHAADLWDAGVAPLIVVTGGNQPGDRFTEATASATYLHDRGVPDEAILREVSGTSSYESLAATARFLREREEVQEVVLVSEPYHSARLRGIASEVGLDAVVSPAQDGGRSFRSLVRETTAVSIGRLIGYRRLDTLVG
ncbi:MAG: YdcF family protein [Actinomycetota bacterium]